MSQQFARDRAAQDAMIRDAISKTGVASPNTMNYRQLQQAVRAGDITGENIKQRFVDPELEARVRNAYAAIGRTGGVVPTLEMPKKGGATADTYKQVRQDEYNYWADQLKQGKISPTDFQNAFLTKAATDIPTTDLEAQRDYVNKARAALGMAALEVPKPRNTGLNIGMARYNTIKSPVNIGMANLGPKLKPKAPVVPTQPIDLSGTAGTPVQLFEKGGDVDKLDAEILANTRLSPDYYAEADKGVIVEKASGKALKDFDKRIAEQSLGTNVAVDPSRYIRKDDTVFPYSERLTVHGWVDPAKPDQVHIQADPGEKYRAFLKRIEAKDKNMQSTFDRVSDKPSLNTLVHEMTHSNQIREAFLPESEYKKKLLLAERYNKAVGIKNDIDNEAYYNPMTGSGLGEKELGAYLNSYEGIHPSAKTVDGKQVVVPFEKSYLGKQMLPPAKGLLKLIEDMGGFTYYGSAQDPETLKYVNKMMGREKRKPTSKK